IAHGQRSLALTLSRERAAMGLTGLFLDTDNNVALAGISESSSVGVDRRLMLTSKRRCPRVLFQLPRCRLHARVLLIPLHQPGANDLMIQVSALQPGESPKPRVGIATYLRRHFRLRQRSDTNRAGRNGVGESD